jgi:hypothetical protein
MPRPAYASLPVAPLTDALRLADFGRGLDKTMGHDLHRSYLRAKKRGTVTPGLGDRICVLVLHSHPSEVFGREWFEAS